MGFKIGNEVSKVGITEQQLKDAVGEKLEKEVSNIFNQFNTNKTANAKNEQVLDQDEQVSLMAYLKGIAGDDNKITRKEVKDQKKTAGSFLQSSDISYKDLKQITAAVSNLLSFNAKGKTEAQDDTDSTSPVVISYSEDGTIETGSGAGTTVYTFEQGNAGTKRLDKKTTGQGESAVTTDLTYGNDGNLSETEISSGGNVVKLGPDGKPTSETISNGSYITIGGHSYPVMGGKVIVNGQTYEVQGNSVTIDGQEYGVKDAADGKIIENSYDSAGNFNKSTVTNGGTVTTTQFNTSGNKSSVTVEEGSGESQKTTVTKYQTDGKTFTSRTITEGQGENQKITQITYGQGQNETTQTVTQGQTVTQTYYSGYNADGSMDNNKLTQTVTTDKTAHTKTTTVDSDVTKIELLDGKNSDDPQRTITFDKDNNTATFSQGDKTVELQTDGSNIIANAKASGTKYETVADAARRLGLTDTSSQAYKDFIEANGGNANDPVPDGKIKIPSNNTNILRSISADDIDVDAAEQVKSIKQEKQRIANEKELARINDNITNRKTRGEAAAKKFNEDHSDNKLRQTYATDKHVVYCQQKYENSKGVHKKDGQDYQQHYVYSPLTGKMEKLEDMINDMPEGQHVKYITQNGYAVLTNGSKIKIDFSNFESRMQTRVNTLTKSAVEFDAGKKAMSQDISASTKTMPYMLDIDGNEFKKTGEVEEEASAADAAQTTGGWTQSDWSSYKAPSGYEKTETTGVLKYTGQGGSYADSPKKGQYYYVNPETKSIGTGNPLGTTEPASAQVHGAAVLSIAQNNSGDTSAQKMKEYITQNIDENNVVEVLNGYSSLNSGDSSLYDTITSEWLHSGQGNGRDLAVQAHKHIMTQLLKKAEEAGVDKESAAYANAQKYANADYSVWIANDTNAHYKAESGLNIFYNVKFGDGSEANAENSCDIGSFDRSLSKKFEILTKDLLTEIDKQKEASET